MFKALYLIRHGRTEANLKRTYVGQTDSPLLPEAFPAFEEMGQYLQGIDFDYFYVSPIGRCQKSFAALKMQGNIVQLVKEERLKEGNNGVLEGAHPSELPADFAAALRADPYRTVFPGGESREMMDARVLEFFKSESPKWEGKTVGILSHWGPNSAIIGHLMEWDWHHRYAWDQPNNTLYKFENDSLSFRLFGKWEGWHEKKFICEHFI